MPSFLVHIWRGIADIEEIQNLIRIHCREASVLLVHDSRCDINLEPLEIQNLLLQGSTSDESVHVDHLLLSNTMGSVHGLEIFLGVPVMLDKDDRISTCQVQTETSNASGQQEHVVGRVAVELVDNVLSLVGFHRTVETEVRH
ncbi:hypothetical protein HG531_011535 [Fusarium graminearum]|nr:hypothetical protein HG531_011535 [Fusarium graminearum]